MQSDFRSTLIKLQEMYKAKLSAIEILLEDDEMINKVGIIYGDSRSDVCVLINQNESKQVAISNVQTNAQRIKKILSTENRFLRKAQIVEIAAKQSKPFGGEGNIGPILTQLKGSRPDDLTKYTINPSWVVWGFNSWIKEGKIKPEHVYDEMKWPHDLEWPQ